MGTFPYCAQDRVLGRSHRVGKAKQMMTAEAMRFARDRTLCPEVSQKSTQRAGFFVLTDNSPVFESLS
jgi:hypothetical protein